MQQMKISGARGFQAEVRAKASVCKGSDQTWERVSCVKGTEIRVSLVAQRLKCLPAMQETWVHSLGWEDPLEKEMSAHSSIPAWEISWTDEAGMLQSTRSNTLNKNNQKQGDMLEGYCSSHTHTQKELIVGFTRVVEMEN